MEKISLPDKLKKFSPLKSIEGVKNQNTFLSIEKQIALTGYFFQKYMAQWICDIKISFLACLSSWEQVCNYSWRGVLHMSSLVMSLEGPRVSKFRHKEWSKLSSASQKKKGHSVIQWLFGVFWRSNSFVLRSVFGCAAYWAVQIRFCTTSIRFWTLRAFHNTGTRRIRSVDNSLEVQEAQKIRNKVMWKY